MRRSDRLLWLAIGLMALIGWATERTYQAPALPATLAPPDQFSAVRAQRTLQGLLSDGTPHPLGSRAGAELRARLLQSLAHLGVTPQLQTGVLVCGRYGSCAMPTNILVRIPGSDPQGVAVLLCAHYDSVPAGPGASDDGASVAALLEITRVLRQRPRPHHDIILLLDEGEEMGLLGAEAFVQHHPWASQLFAVVNLDARGSSGRSLMFETGSANAWLLQVYAHAVAHPLTNSVFYQAYQRLPNDTDFSVFKAAGYQGFNLAYIGDVMRYHTPLDDVQHADPRSIEDQGQLALATVWALANAASPPDSHAQSVYFDVFGRVLIRLPPQLMFGLAGAVWLLATACCLQLLRRSALTRRELAWGLCGTVLALIAGAVLAPLARWTLANGSSLAPRGLFSFVAHPAGLMASFAALAVLVLSLGAAIVRGRAGEHGGLCAVAMVVASLGLFAAWQLPAASYLWVLPALMLALTLAALRWPLLSACLLLLSVVLSAILWSPITLLQYDALGSAGLVTLCLMLMQALLPATVLYLNAGAAARRLVVALTLVVGVGSLTAADVAPRYTAQSPQRISIRYVLQPQLARAQWLLELQSGTPPAPMLRGAQFEARAVFPWSDGPVLTAAAAPSEFTAARIDIRVIGCDTLHVHYRVHLDPGLDDSATLLFESGISVGTLTSHPEDPNAAVSVRTLRVGNGWNSLQLYTVPPQGYELTLEAAQAGLELDLLETRYGLPSHSPPRAARPIQAVASDRGDRTEIWRRWRLPGCASAN